MKPVALFAGSSLAFLVLASIPVACVSSNASPNEDSGAPPGQDGAPPSEDAAPSGSDATLPDAGTDAPEKDSATEDAGPQPLTVHVLLGLAPESGVLVVFQDASGAVVSSATTDATGSVSQLVTAGSQVTVALGTTLAPRLVTIQAVEPGDVLTLVDTPPASTLAENVNVTLPAPTWDASGATEYVYAAQCGTSAGSPVYVNPDCQLNGQFPLLAYAQASGGQELAYTYQTGNALLEDGGTDAITVTRPWATSSVVEQLTTSSLPAGITGDVQFTYDEVSGGVATARQAVQDTTDDAGVLTSAFTVHSGFADFQQSELFAYVGGDSNSLSGVVGAIRSAPTSASEVTAFDGALLPLITAANVDSTDAGTTAQPAVTWTSAGSLSSATGIIVNLQWYFSPTDGGDQYVNGNWTLVAPPTATSISAPAMPASASAWVPYAGSYYSEPPQFAAVAGSLVPTYATVRAGVGAVSLYAAGYSATPPLLPANGSLIATVFYPDEG